MLDGDNLRHGLSKDLGFTDADRAENNRRAAEVAKLMTDAGLIVIAAFVSPFRADRATTRALLRRGRVRRGVRRRRRSRSRPSATRRACTRRRARAASQNFTGIGSPYEPPESPEVHLDMAALGIEEAADRIVAAARGARAAVTWQFVLAGLAIGVLVGMTGMGGGSLMTPILVFIFGFNPATAIGTDILHGAIFKTRRRRSRHYKLGTTQAKLSGWMFIGSAPASLLGVTTSTWLKHRYGGGIQTTERRGARVRRSCSARSACC